MRILIATSELHPYSKSGGLADMVVAFAKSLDRARQQVGVVTPLYHGIREQFPELQPFDWHMRLPLAGDWVQAKVWTTSVGPGVTVYFIDQRDFFERVGLYQENDFDYPDNARRFIFFSKAVVHLARHLPWQPEIVHLHDWQTGLVPLLIQHQRLAEGWGRPPATCLTIHNLAFQGIFPAADYALTNLPQDYFHPRGVEFYGCLNCLKAGLTYADMLTTVSPRYAREITTPEFGCGLDGLLRERQDRLVGILNGVDYDEWNTQNNPFLEASYDALRLGGKIANKAALQREFGLPEAPDVPLFANITRLTEQKGIRILLTALEEMLASNMQFLQLGSGQASFEEAVCQLARRYPQKAAVRLGFNHPLSHRIEAGADFFIMPSRYEPCGLNQLYSLRYGTVPIVRTTGGLDDTVVDITENVDRANGIKFREHSATALAKAIRKALELYRHPRWLRRYRRNGMRANFSWKQTCHHYLGIYRELLRTRR